MIRFGIGAMVLFVATAMITPLPLRAQVTEIDPFGGLDPLTVELQPEYPQPDSTFLVIPQSTLLDLANAHITITVNGVVVSETTGKTPVAVTAPGPGQPLIITVRADIENESYTVEVPLYLQEVTLVLEPSTTLPPFYKGAALTSARGSVRIVAIPNFQTPQGRIPDAELSYQWGAGDRELGEFSGIGRSVLQIVAPQIYRDTTVSLIVTSQDKQYAAYGTVVLAPTQPLVRVYRKDPLLGILSVPALGNTFAMLNDEQMFFAAPYHFQKKPDLVWRTGNTSFTGDTITVRSAGKGASTADLSLNAKITEQDIFSAADFSTMISFGRNTPASSLFGL